MKREYDFSKGERGKFYKPDAVFNLPVYLDRDNRDFVERLARSRRVDVATVVNEIIRLQAQGGGDTGA